MANEFYELHIARDGRWSVIERYDASDRDDAIETAKMHFERDEVDGVKVTKEQFDEASGTYRPRTVFRTMKPRASGPPAGYRGGSSGDSLGHAPRWTPPPPQGPPHGEFGVRPKGMLGPSLAVIALILVVMGGIRLTQMQFAPGTGDMQMFLLVVGSAVMVGLGLLAATVALRRMNASVGPLEPRTNAAAAAQPRPSIVPPAPTALPPSLAQDAAPTAEPTAPAPEPLADAQAVAQPSSSAPTELAQFIHTSLAADPQAVRLMEHPRLRFGAGLYALGAADAMSALRAPGTDPGQLLVPVLISLGFAPARAQRFAADVPLMRDPPRYAQLVQAGSRAMVEALAERPLDPPLGRALAGYQRTERPADALVVLASCAVELEGSEARRSSVRRAHDRLTESVAAGHSGTLLNADVDGERQYSFTTVGAALASVADIQRQVRSRNLETGSEDVKVRMTLVTGLPSPEAPGIAPTTARLIARALAASAMPGEVLVGDTVAEALIGGSNDGLSDTTLLGSRRSVVVDAAMPPQGVRPLLSVPGAPAPGMAEGANPGVVTSGAEVTAPAV